ncbi:MAG TPA: cysteine--tRNA ligase [Chitinivibrionales bacterium]|nr:cysteine--tRNA ligase [Chitinivibrionales bacterium]
MFKKFLIFNTASRQKEEFVPLHDPVSMYCCGPTVYNFAHIGNLRTYIFEDVLKRVLLALGYKVKHVVNITDVGHLTSDADTGEDKMEKGASREGKTVWQIAEYYTGVFKQNLKDLNIIEPQVWPKATDHIPEMIKMIAALKDKGFTYKTGDGIYFDTTKFPAYADFARLDIDNLQAGSRVDMGDKRSATDFALWKFSPKDKKRQMEWDSPWGKGFPGWHIECSAMSLNYCGQPIDIHCGGMDHVRVHHTNEIAQAEAATGKPFVKYWLHGEFLVLDKGKMAKSSGDFLTLDSVKQAAVPPLAYRMFCYTAHYRSPLMFSWDGLKSAAQGLANLKKLIFSETKKPAATGSVSHETVDRILGPFYDALCDDMNMPVACAHAWTVLKDKALSAEEKYEAIEAADTVLGLDLLKDDRAKEIISEVEKNDVRLKLISSSILETSLIDKVVSLAAARQEARRSKAFDKADRIRKELAGLGVEIKDLPGGIAECRVAARP